MLEDGVLFPNENGDQIVVVTYDKETNSICVTNGNLVIGYGNCIDEDKTITLFPPINLENDINVNKSLVNLIKYV